MFMFIREAAVSGSSAVLRSAAMQTENNSVDSGQARAALERVDPRQARAAAERVSSRQALTTAIVLAVALAVLTAVLGFFDGTGLFAPENWVDAGAFPRYATSPAWATVTFLPLLVGGSGLALYTTVRAARQGIRAGWVLGAAWSTVALTAFVAKLLYSLLLLVVAGPQNLHLLPAVGAVLAECGLCGAKYVFFGPLAAGPAVLAYLISARRARRRRPPADAEPGRAWSPVWILAGVLVATAVARTSYPWIEGGDGGIVLPTFGLAGTWAAFRIMSPRVQRGLAAPNGMAAWWVRAAVMTAAGAIGFLLPFAVDGVVSGFGGALYSVVGALMHVAAGLTAAAVTCALGLAWNALLARTPAGALAASRTGRTGARYAAAGIAAAALLGAYLIPSELTSAPVSDPVPSAASLDSGGLLALTVLHEPGRPPVIGDSAGGQVLLRGVNVNQLVDYGQPNRTKPTVRPLSESDYAQMASIYGFDVQRLNLSWSQIEPIRGHFSMAYIARIRAAVDWAAKHGIYTVLDMHQDTYSKYVTAPPGTTCRLGATPEFGNDGAPEWATITDGAKGCGFMGSDLSPNVGQSFTNLYDNTDGIGTQLADTWAVLARAFAGDTAVAGYDLLNEPGPGNAPGVTSSLLLGRLYQQIITSIRHAEASAPGGYHHLVFFEPSILWSGLGFDVTPPVGFSHDPDLVFSPHLYSQSITMDQGLGVTLVTIEHGFATAERTAAAYGVPLWSGEWGWFGSQTADSQDVDRFLDTQNAARLGSAIWVWKQACGSPQSSPTSRIGGNIRLYSCATGQVLPSPAAQTTALDQAYPRAAPGWLVALTSSPTGVDLRLSGTGTGVLDVWIPGTARPTVKPSGLRDLNLIAQPSGGWRLMARAAGRYGLTVR
jgi:hypothetical protein